MESLYLLVPLALIFLVLAIKLLFWAVNSGQYDDLNTEGHRILFDDTNPDKNVENFSLNQESSSDAEHGSEVSESSVTNANQKLD